MECLRIRGGKQLHGTVAVSGSKNASLPILTASILTQEPVRLVNVPDLLDVDTLLLVLEQLGVASQRQPNGDLLLETMSTAPARADYQYVSRMRASFCVLGPLLARRGYAVVSLPGGCNIGPRPVDLHLKALEALGAEISIRHGYVIATANRLRGATVCMRGPHGTTVTGTANILCAATLAEGVTTITGAALEPEIEDLGRFLITMGADIDGLGTSEIIVRGRRELAGASYRIGPDRIEASTLLLTTAITGGMVRVEGLNSANLTSVLDALETTGVSLETTADSVTITADNRTSPTTITALPFPGIPTDLQAQWLALLSLADGESSVEDRVFPHRWLHVAELKRLGANITVNGSKATIRGVSKLSGAQVTATDIRAGAALVMAGLAAKGETILHGIEHLHRGYCNLAEKLRSLGADIELLQTQSPRSPAYPPDLH